MNVDVLNESGAQVDVEELTRLCRFTMRRMRLHPATELCLRLVEPDTITVLNEQWMGKQGPTDVLSFPMDELSPGRDDAEAPEGYLGDIALCPQVAEQQAPGLGRETIDEIRLLTVHGILHLLGYDHAEPEEHREMFGLQDRLLGEWQVAREGGDVEAASS
ncbi:rRNA maturation RNase YbeY [Solicola sp. PLA-1-18]|uniref:rRNA maturation RNase YbeY n=1 Tax=Solicola sp. PLA-1-18 TaxID=3380532 RepID=UPI003B7B255C